MRAQVLKTALKYDRSEALWQGMNVLNGYVPSEWT